MYSEISTSRKKWVMFCFASSLPRFSVNQLGHLSYLVRLSNSFSFLVCDTITSSFLCNFICYLSIYVCVHPHVLEHALHMHNSWSVLNNVHAQLYNVNFSCFVLCYAWGGTFWKHLGFFTIVEQTQV